MEIPFVTLGTKQIAEHTDVTCHKHRLKFHHTVQNWPMHSFCLDISPSEHM